MANLHFKRMIAIFSRMPKEELGNLYGACWNTLDDVSINLQSGDKKMLKTQISICKYIFRTKYNEILPF